MNWPMDEDIVVPGEESVNEFWTKAMRDSGVYPEMFGQEPEGDLMDWQQAEHIVEPGEETGEGYGDEWTHLFRGESNFGEVGRTA